MRKRFIWGMFILFVAGLVFTVTTSVTNAKPGKNDGKGQRGFHIPEHAIEVVPGKMFWLGTAMEKGKMVEGYAIIHHRKGFGKPGGCNNDGVCQGWEEGICPDCQGGGVDTDTSSCYGFLSAGAKWKDVEDYVVDTANGDALPSDFILAALEAGIRRWEDAADGRVDGSITHSVIGGQSVGSGLIADTESPDGKNEVLFGEIAGAENAIAVTIVWGVFRGPVKHRALVEWDQVYDDWDFTWADCLDCSTCCTEEGAMDFENIATHELGHSIGLGDLYSDQCKDATMYGYAGHGETNKRELGAGDINGVYSLYN